MMDFLIIENQIVNSPYGVLYFSCFTKLGKGNRNLKKIYPSACAGGFFFEIFVLL